MSRLPVFPLDVVVFPGMTVPLHVYEERYKRLAREVLAQPDEPKRFITAYAEPGPKISDVPPRLARYGTVVHVLTAEENPDGTFDLLVHGQDRTLVAIDEVVEVPERGGASRPLAYAEERPAPLRRGDPNDEAIAAWDALDAFRAYAGTRFRGDAGSEIDKHVPDDLFYQASFVCANILVPTAAKQTLLEAGSLQERFDLAMDMMQKSMRRRARPRRGKA